jgi:uncharacterized protein (TIRG00374 family)
VRSRRAGLLIVQTLLGLVLLVAWLWIVDLDEVFNTLSRTRIPPILLATALYVSSWLIRALRWDIILQPIARVPTLDLWLISTASSLVNFIIPLRTGELARSLLLKQRYKISVSNSLPTVAIDRSFDLLAILILGAIGAVSGLRLESRLSIVFMAGSILFLVFAVFVSLVIIFGERMLSIADRLLSRRMDASLRSSIMGIIKGFVSGFVVVGRNPRGLIPMLILSLLSAALDSAAFYCLLISLGEIAQVTVVITGYALFTLTFLVPGAPGYIGSMEAFGSLIFGAVGLGKELSASVVLLYHALNTIMLGALGGVAMWALGLRPSTALRSIVDSRELNAEAELPRAET